MTQPKLKQLVKLLKEWESEFSPTADPENSQPCYGELIRLITRQVEREID